MTEDLLHDPDVYAELDQHRGGCVSSVMHTSVPDAGHSEKVFPEEALQAAEIKAVESATATSGVAGFLEACEAADRPVAIVSNNCEASVHSYLEHAGLSDRVRHVEARDPIHVDRMKPSPYLVLRAASALGIEPVQSVLVGDQVSDIVAASAAGARSVGYANKPGKADDLARAGATAVIDDMKDLSSMLGLAI